MNIFTSGCDEATEFSCQDKGETCISAALTCDNVNDCPDGSDERNCPGKSQTATTGKFATTVSGVLYSKTRAKLGVNFSDPQEERCLTIPKPCDIYSGGFTHGGTQHRGCLTAEEASLPPSHKFVIQ